MWGSSSGRRGGGGRQNNGGKGVPGHTPQPLLPHSSIHITISAQMTTRETWTAALNLVVHNVGGKPMFRRGDSDKHDPRNS
ncbi:hypothetical protein JTB14_018406 [Gonioctena quinquepunctata]|nr:hypothetical protein JTB14_018406 [Gonioctena quinquepunctata]